MALSLQYDEAAVIRAYFADRLKGSINDAVMIDVGADFGTSLRAYRHAGWRVVAFEPDSRKFAKLSQFEGKPGFELLKLAVGDQPAASIPFFTSPESTGISSLLAFRDSHTVQANVPVVTLRQVLSDRGIRKIDFLKIDTEGYDLAVLRGHDWTIRPEVILTEFDEVKTRHLGHHFDALADLLILQSYTVFLSEWFPLERYGANHRWRSVAAYPCGLAHNDAWGNFIAVRNDANVARMSDLLGPHVLSDKRTSPCFAG